MITHFNWQV